METWHHINKASIAHKNYCLEILPENFVYPFTMTTLTTSTQHKIIRSVAVLPTAPPTVAYSQSDPLTAVKIITLSSLWNSKCQYYNSVLTCSFHDAVVSHEPLETCGTIWLKILPFTETHCAICCRILCCHGYRQPPFQCCKCTLLLLACNMYSLDHSSSQSTALWSSCQILDLICWVSCTCSLCEASSRVQPMQG